MGVGSLSQVIQALLDRMPPGALVALRILIGATLAVFTAVSLRFAPNFGLVLVGGLILVWVLTASDGLALVPIPLFALSFVALLAIGFPLGVWEGVDDPLDGAYVIWIVLFALCSTGFCWMLKQEDGRARRRRWYQETYVPAAAGRPLPESAFRPLPPHPIGAVRQVMLKQWTWAVVLAFVGLAPWLLFIFGIALWMRQRWTALAAAVLGGYIEISRLVENVEEDGFLTPNTAIAVMAMLLSATAWIEAMRLPLWPRRAYRRAREIGVAAEPAIACKDGIFVYAPPTP
ncbi:hypothetical protein GCM10027089_40940 [Nocardia thraciensis]